MHLYKSTSLFPAALPSSRGWPLVPLAWCLMEPVPHTGLELELPWNLYFINHPAAGRKLTQGARSLLAAWSQDGWQGSKGRERKEAGGAHSVGAFADKQGKTVMKGVGGCVSSCRETEGRFVCVCGTVLDTITEHLCGRKSLFPLPNFFYNPFSGVLCYCVVISLVCVSEISKCGAKKKKFHGTKLIH